MLEAQVLKMITQYLFEATWMQQELSLNNKNIQSHNWYIYLKMDI